MEDLEAFFAYRKLTEAEKVGAFALLLHNEAKYWYGALENRDKMRFKELKERFEARFKGNAATTFRDLASVAAVKQLPAESVEQFFARAHKLANRANATEDVLSYALINGLTPRIRQHVLTSGADNAEKIREAALLAEGAVGEETDANSLMLQSIIARLDRMEPKVYTVEETPKYQPKLFQQKPEFQPNLSRNQPEYQQGANRDQAQYQPKSEDQQGQGFQPRQQWQPRPFKPTGGYQNDRAPGQWRPQSGGYQNDRNPGQYGKAQGGQTSRWNQSGQGNQQGQSNSNQGERRCYWCGMAGIHPHNMCPASSQLCQSCGKQGHYASVCRSRQTTGGPGPSQGQAPA